MPTPAAAIPAVRMNLKLDPVTHQRLKVWCAERGQTMQGAVARMLDRAFSSDSRAEPPA